MIFDKLEISNQIILVKVFLEKYPHFELPFGEKASDILESLEIKEYVITWK
jgi:hypothetical protein